MFIAHRICLFGDVGYRYLIRALADGGRSDVLYAMNDQSDKPGYGYQLKMGATSLTEAWDARRRSSQNHFMLGQSNEWFYHDLAGIQCDPAGPGFKQIIVKPAIVGDLSFVRAEFDSPHGKICNAWTRTGQRLSMNVTIPVNTTARIYMPGNDAHSAQFTAGPLKEAPGITSVQMERDATVIGVGSGSYSFILDVAEPMRKLE